MRFFHKEFAKGIEFFQRQLQYGCGYIDPGRAEEIYRMLAHYFASEETKPIVISVGSGKGYHEKRLENLGLTVHCHDKVYKDGENMGNTCSIVDPKFETVM